MALAGGKGRLWLAAFALVVAVLATQVAADRLVPVASRADAPGVLGRSGFAYLAGIRTYTAAVLWSRLDPINDEYYETLPLGEKKFLLPTIRLAIALDPNFDEPYFVGPFVLWEAGLKDDAMELASEGTERNPGSALLHASRTQLLLTAGRFAEAGVEAERAMRAEWKSESDFYNMLAPLEIAFDRTGAKERADFIRAERVRLSAQFELGQGHAHDEDCEHDH